MLQQYVQTLFNALNHQLPVFLKGQTFEAITLDILKIKYSGSTNVSRYIIQIPVYLISVIIDKLTKIMGYNYLDAVSVWPDLFTIVT